MGMLLCLQPKPLGGRIWSRNAAQDCATFSWQDTKVTTYFADVSTARKAREQLRRIRLYTWGSPPTVSTAIFLFLALLTCAQKLFSLLSGTHLVFAEKTLYALLCSAILALLIRHWRNSNASNWDMHYSSVGTPKKRWNQIGVVENMPLLWTRFESQFDDVRTRDDCLFERPFERSG